MFLHANEQLLLCAQMKGDKRNNSFIKSARYVVGAQPEIACPLNHTAAGLAIEQARDDHDKAQCKSWALVFKCSHICIDVQW